MSSGQEEAAHVLVQQMISSLQAIEDVNELMALGHVLWDGLR